MALSTLEIKHAKPGMHADGNGLYLQVHESGARSWVFRYQLNGRRREMGLGSLASLSVGKARARAEELKGIVRAKRDPLAERQAETIAKAEAEKVGSANRLRETKTFKTVAAEYIRAHGPSWRNAKHAQQWENTLATYVFPAIGDLPIGDVTTDHVLSILRPLWTAKPETASRLRSRMELVISYAKARGWSLRENPASWRGHLAALLPAASKVKKVRHHPALPWNEMSPFMMELQGCAGVAAKALQFAILTAARSGEVRGARWSEIDLDGRLWTVPGARMKAGREHRVPLSSAAVQLLSELPRIDDDALVFSGASQGASLSDMSLTAVLRRLDRQDITVHGFRSTFRDWAAETTFHHPDLVELALAHTIKNKVEAAYRRGDLIEKRRTLMEDWAIWCLQSGAERVRGPT